MNLTSADPVLAEALNRIEHKVDLTLLYLAALTGIDKLTSVGSDKHVCPLCATPVAYQVDLLKSVVRRVCKCSTGIIPPLVGTFTNQETEKKNGQGNVKEDNISSDRGGESSGR